jgi:hypothetical protein
MKTRLIAVMCAGLLAFQFACGSETNTADEMMPDLGNIEMKKVTVLKVFSAEEEGAKYRAYLVKWNNQEVVVQDILGGPAHKAGDTVKVMAQKLDMPGSKILQFIICDIEAMLSPMLDSSEDVQAPKKKKKKPASRPLPGTPATPSKMGPENQK